MRRALIAVITSAALAAVMVPDTVNAQETHSHGSGYYAGPDPIHAEEFTIEAGDTGGSNASGDGWYAGVTGAVSDRCDLFGSIGAAGPMRATTMEYGAMCRVAETENRFRLRPEVRVASMHYMTGVHTYTAGVGAMIGNQHGARVGLDIGRFDGESLSARARAGVYFGF